MVHVVVHDDFFKDLTTLLFGNGIPKSLHEWMLYQTVP